MKAVLVGKDKSEKSNQIEGAPEPKKPELAFDPIKPNGKFHLLFDKGLTGLDFINEIGVEIKTKGKISDLYADEKTPEKKANLRRLESEAIADAKTSETEEKSGTAATSISAGSFDLG